MSGLDKDIEQKLCVKWPHLLHLRQTGKIIVKDFFHYWAAFDHFSFDTSTYKSIYKHSKTHNLSKYTPFDNMCEDHQTAHRN